MKILRNYLAKEIIVATTLVLLAFLALFSFFDLLAELENVGQAGYTLRHAAMYVLLSIPSRAYEVLPIAVLIGTLYALAQLARHSEITVMRASGVSTWRFLRTLFWIGCLFAIFTFVLGEFLAPPLDRVAQKWRLRNTQAAVANVLRSGTWLRDGHLFINAGVVNQDGGMENIRIDEFDDAQNLVSISQAERGEYSPRDSNWRLYQVVQTHFEPASVRVETLPQAQWRSVLTPELISVVMLVPERMAVKNLYPYIEHLKENNQKTGRYEIAFWKKLVYPFATLVMMALALPFAYAHHRSGTVSARVLMGVMIGIGFHLLNSLFSNLGIINSWQPQLTAATPSMFFLLIAGASLWWVERR